MRVLFPEQVDELRRLYERLGLAVDEAANALRSDGVISDRFQDADDQVSDLNGRIRRLLGD